MYNRLYVYQGEEKGMVAIEIEQVKSFMSKLLVGDLFDQFLMREGKLTMSISYEFDGTLQEEFYDSDQWELIKEYQYISWKSEKTRIFSLIKGKKTPLSFRFVLMLTRKKVEEFVMRYNIPVDADEIAGLFINVYFQRGVLTCTPGVSRKTFVADHTLEQMWDEEMKQYLKEFM
jgi:hypothetical protein